MSEAYAYHRPTTLEEAFGLFARSKAPCFIAGGTDLLVKLKKRRMAPPSDLISLRNIEALRSCGLDGTTRALRIGAGVPLADVLSHPVVAERYPALVAGLEVLGSRQIRNVATLGGNLVNASPAADSAPPLLAYDASVELVSSRGTRTVPLAQLFLGPGKTALAKDEVLSAVVLPESARSFRARFARRGRVRMDLAIASVAVGVELEGRRCVLARVAAGAVAPMPLRLTEVESLLSGAMLDDGLIGEAASRASSSVTPIDDLRSTAAYRRRLVGVFVRRALQALREEA